MPAESSEEYDSNISLAPTSTFLVELAAQVFAWTQHSGCRIETTFMDEEVTGVRYYVAQTGSFFFLKASFLVCSYTY